MIKLIQYLFLSIFLITATSNTLSHIYPVEPHGETTIDQNFIPRKISILCTFDKYRKRTRVTIHIKGEKRIPKISHQTVDKKVKKFIVTSDGQFGFFTEENRCYLFNLHDNNYYQIQADPNRKIIGYSTNENFTYILYRDHSVDIFTNYTDKFVGTFYARQNEHPRCCRITGNVLFTFYRDNTIDILDMKACQIIASAIQADKNKQITSYKLTGDKLSLLCQGNTIDKFDLVSGRRTNIIQANQRKQIISWSMDNDNIYVTYHDNTKDTINHKIINPMSTQILTQSRKRKRDDQDNENPKKKRRYNQ